MPLTEAEKSARKRQKKRDAGQVLYHKWVEKKQAADFDAVLAGKATIQRINPQDKYNGTAY